jgi:hypothetical protein
MFMAVGKDRIHRWVLVLVMLNLRRQLPHYYVVTINTADIVVVQTSEMVVIVYPEHINL